MGCLRHVDDLDLCAGCYDELRKHAAALRAERDAAVEALKDAHDHLLAFGLAGKVDGCIIRIRELISQSQGGRDGG